MPRVYNNFCGMLLVDKPSGITSFKIVSLIRHKLKVKKVGHCGTLDPLATGLLIILVGAATKLQDGFMKQDKVYTATLKLGLTTDTGDTDGAIIACVKPNVTIEQLSIAAKKFTGTINQIPPMYSALKVNGKKLYELARQGITVERKSRSVTIRNIDILSELNSFDGQNAQLRVDCSSGTYIRTLAEDIGKELGCGAAISALRRESIGSFSVESALIYDDIMSLSVDELAQKLTPVY
ncbi:MAG: tRNA pseudouridine(55) synthase TruB [Elusimicrobia bacterium]|nr:tRNA pseudouridine(55) synthase TruB [Elusimicrobiota bacterium]